MPEFDSELQNRKSEASLPPTEINAVLVRTDFDYYKKTEAPPRPGGTEKESRWEHIREHKPGLKVAFKTDNPREIIKKLAEISGAENKNIREFIDVDTNRLIKYDVGTGVVVVIGGLRNISNPPPFGEIITAYKADPGSVERKLNTSRESRGPRWQPHTQKFGQDVARVQ